MIGKLLYNYNPAINGPDPKKEKKFIFLDRFIPELFSQKVEESTVVEGIVGSHLLRICDEMYFYRDRRGEVDFLCKQGNRLVPVEVKWKNEIKPSDVIHMKKFECGFLITKDTFETYEKILAVPAFVFLALIGVTISKRRIF